MEKKYYTPSIEEFHVGFEFDVLNNKDKFYDPQHEVGKWLNATVDNGIFSDLQNISRLLIDGQIRVKHLDREDIKSLGWKYVPATKTFELIDLAGYEWELIFIPQTLSVDIDLYKGNPFSGTIRSKSELATIMRMIGIKN